MYKGIYRAMMQDIYEDIYYNLDEACKDHYLREKVLQSKSEEKDFSFEPDFD